MQVIPVIDIRRGIAVHARGGERGRYRPVQSCLTPSADPLMLLERLHAAFQCEEVYVADLDALEEIGENLAVVAALADHVGGVRLLVDAGVRSPADAERLLDLGVTHVVLASETSAGPHEIAEIARAVGFERVVCSLDVRQRSVVWGSPASPLRSPADALASLGQRGVRSVIILEMDRIGAETGVDVHFLAPLIQRHREMRILVGGGVRDIRDLLMLRDIGAAGALVGTALHRGTISRENLGVLSGKACHGAAQAGSW
jgi:phosphoribosylformimino-5-aminoimidazole carboxamide ribotide isomerase